MNMKPDNTRDDVTPPRKGQQLPESANSDLSVEILQQPVPKLPHEADQSTRNKETEIRPEMLQAKRDVESGMQDTGRLPVVNEVYRRQKK